MNYINKYNTLGGGGRERGKDKKELCERQKQREREIPSDVRTSKLLLGVHPPVRK